MESYDTESLWYAVWTRSRQEKVAAATLKNLGIETFLPLKSEIRQWSDRKQKVEVPLFSGYLFVRLNLLKQNKLQVLKVPGVGSFVGNQNGSLPIPDHQIEDIRTVLSVGVQCSTQSFLEEGDRVRVMRGPLAGIEGTLTRSGSNSTSRLLISIEMIRQSLSVNVSLDDVEPVQEEPVGMTHFARSASIRA